MAEKKKIDNNKMSGKPVRHRWTPEEERLLMDIVNNGDSGALRRILVENVTNIRLSRHDAWERVT